MICSSIELPKEIIVVISGSECDRKVEKAAYCNIKINLYYRKEEKNSASNKNYGFKYSKCNYVSFFDSDDIMSQDRIKMLNYIIKNYNNYDIILHMYTRNYTELKIHNNSVINNINKYFYLNSSYIAYLYKTHIHSHKVQLWGCCHFLPIHYLISNGWITIKRSMFISEKFNEDLSFQRAEDSEYNGRVISKGYRALILRIVLGYYSIQNACNIINDTIQNP